jgi:hypothetical protein
MTKSTEAAPVSKPAGTGASAMQQTKGSSPTGTSSQTLIDYHICKIGFGQNGVTFAYNPQSTQNAIPPYTSTTDQEAYEREVDPVRRKATGAASSDDIKVPDAAFNRRVHTRTFSHVRTSQIAYVLPRDSGWIFAAPGFGLKRNPADSTQFLGEIYRFTNLTISETKKVCEVTYTPDGQEGSEFQYELYLEADVVPSPNEDHAVYLKIIIDPPANNGAIPPGP